MKPICFYFQIHEDYELKNYDIFSIGFSQQYFDIEKTKEILAKKIYDSYLPMNQLLLKLFKEHGSKFKVSFSISGVTLDLFEKYFPDMISSFKELAKTGNVEFLAETYYHSLSSLYSKNEFEKQVEIHSRRIEELFNQKPTTFRNSELLYSNEIGDMISDMGFTSTIAFGWNSVLKLNSPNFLYKVHNHKKDVNIFLGNPQLSSDLEEKFSDTSWMHYPLSSQTYCSWISTLLEKEELVNIFLEYETFGITHRKDSGIFDFFEHFISHSLANSLEFSTPSLITNHLEAKKTIDIPSTISWTNTFEDAFSWMGNPMQKQSSAELYELGSMVSEIDDPMLSEHFRILTNSNYFYKMCTHLETKQYFHGKFSHHETPYDSYIHFMNILRDLTLRVKQKYEEKIVSKGVDTSSSTSSLEELRTLAMR